MAEREHHETNYVKIWAILLVLLGISILGPMAEIKLLTLITAFGIAIIKAYIVAKNFMHLNIERKYVAYLLLVCVALMVLMFVFVAPDVMHHHGQNWDNNAALEHSSSEMKRLEASGGGH